MRKQGLKSCTMYIKKEQKTPSKEIAKAEEIRKQYFNSKK